jgi:hypothetical protein
MSYKTGGWINKYHIAKVCPECSDRDSSCVHCGGTGCVDIDENAVYFVLRLDEDPHARRAMLTYADSVSQTNQQLACDIWRKIAEIPQNNAFIERIKSLRHTYEDGRGAAQANDDQMAFDKLSECVKLLDAIIQNN